MELLWGSETEASGDGDRGAGRVVPAHILLIALLTVTMYAPTLHNGFLPLGFDDALVTKTPTLHALTGVNLVAWFTTFSHAHYVPVTMASLAIDYRLWGLDPFGYHLGNVLLHALGAMLLYAFLVQLLPVARLAMFAALVFAVHPIQMEAVSVVVQRKTVLSGAVCFLTLLLYQRWRRVGGGSAYLGTLGAFTAAALAKPSVVTVPVFLVLYDLCLVGRVRLGDKVPFVVVGAAVTVAAAAAHAAVGAVLPPHGDSWVLNLLLTARVVVEYVDALLLPVGLSPRYFYPRGTLTSPLNVAALAGLLVGTVAATAWRRRVPWIFFCSWWFVIVLLPESNAFPLAQVRADRFAYLAVAPFGVLVAMALWHVDGRFGARTRIPVGTGVVGPVVVGVLATVCYGSAAVWRDDVSAWARAVDRHPWCAVARVMLGQAHFERGAYARAEEQLTVALQLDPRQAEAHLHLGRLALVRGDRGGASQHASQALALAPADSEVRAFVAALTRGDEPVPR